MSETHSARANERVSTQFVNLQLLEEFRHTHVNFNQEYLTSFIEFMITVWSIISFMFDVVAPILPNPYNVILNERNDFPVKIITVPGMKYHS